MLLRAYNAVKSGAAATTCNVSTLLDRSVITPMDDMMDRQYSVRAETMRYVRFVIGLIVLWLLAILAREVFNLNCYLIGGLGVLVLLGYEYSWSVNCKPSRVKV